MNLIKMMALPLVLVLASLSGAQEAKPLEKLPIDKLPLDDQYIMKALVANNATLRLAELVESRSENPKVEAFAREVIADHKKASEKIGKLVTDRKLAVVAGLEEDVRNEIERLSKLKGNEFDREYLDAFIRRHDHCVRMCKEQMNAGKEPTAQAFARECVPTLESHLKQARELRAGLPK